MIISILMVLLGVPLQTEVPFKPNEEFQLQVDYKFKVRTGNNSSTLQIDFDKGNLEEKKTADGPLPYLIINFKMLKLSDQEVRVKVINNFGKLFLTKKIKAGEDFKLDLGFTDDMKDRVTAYEYNIYFINSDKKEVSMVHFYIHEDGTFLVNNEKRGKF